MPGLGTENTGAAVEKGRDWNLEDAPRVLKPWPQQFHQRVSPYNASHPRANGLLALLLLSKGSCRDPVV